MLELTTILPFLKLYHFQIDFLHLIDHDLITAKSNLSWSLFNWPFYVHIFTSFHFLLSGRVAINTEQGSEALTVHGNIQLSGQVMQPSDVRIKRVLKEVDPKEQLENVKKIKIVQYKYRPEFLSQLPQEERLDTIQDFLIKLGIKPLMDLLELGIFSLYHVIVRSIKIMNRADKNWAHF